MQYARKMHSALRKKLCALDNEQVDKESKIVESWCQNRELLMQDFTAVCPSEKYLQRPYLLIDNSSYKPKGINDADMAGLQFKFVVNIVVHCPEVVGIYDATDEEIEAYCYM
ncbi:hypothetical protein P5V15_006273 [Pogonomyrmex californicus]